MALWRPLEASSRSASTVADVIVPGARDASRPVEALELTFPFGISRTLGASLAPYVATWLATHHGLQYVGYYLSGATFLTLIALLFAKNHK